MAKRVKSNFLIVRGDDSFIEEIEEYIELTETDKSELTRNAIKEYMENHPVEPKPKEETE